MQNRTELINALGKHVHTGRIVEYRGTKYVAVLQGTGMVQHALDDSRYTLVNKYWASTQAQYEYFFICN